MKLKRLTSLCCAAALLLTMTAPTMQVQALETQTEESGSTTPVMPKELQEREATVHTYDMQKWPYGDTGGDEPVLDGALIMPGDTIFIPVDVRDYKGGYCVLFAGSFNVLDSGQTSSDTSPYFRLIEKDYNYTDGFVREGEITDDDLALSTRTFVGEKTHAQQKMVFNERIVNSLNTPIVVGMNETGDGGAIVEGYTQFHFIPTLTTYSPYYKITYPVSTDEGSYEGLDTYFWPQGEYSTLSFPSEYWLTDVPYKMTLPNPVQKGCHFKSWGSADRVTQEKDGMYTNITVQWSTNSYSQDIFSGYGDRELEPYFDSGNTITFVGNGGKIKGFSEYVAEAPESNDGTFELEDYVPEKAGDTFLGWCTKESALYGSFVTLDDEDEIYNNLFGRYATNVTLYAKWESDTETILENEGWDITDDGTLRFLNDKGAEAWVKACENDKSLAPRVKKVKFGYKDEKVTYIPMNGFNGCKNLTDVSFSNDITQLSSNVFEGCDSLKTVTFEGKPYYGIADTFRYAPKDVVVRVPGDKVDSYEEYLKEYSYLIDSDKRYDLSVNGQVITDKNLTVDCGEGKATFDPNTNTLTLENADFTSQSMTPHWLSPYSDRENWIWYDRAAVISGISGLNIVVKGNNIVRSTGDYKDDFIRSHGDVNISGDGNIECIITVNNYLVQDENGEMVPYSGVYTLPLTVEGDLTLKNITAKRLNISNSGSLTIDGALLSGGVFTPRDDLKIRNGAKLEHYTPVGTTGTYDRLDDVTPVVGGRNIEVYNSIFDYVTINAGDACDSITLQSSEIQLTDKLTAAEHTKLDIIDTTLNAYGKSDGVTNIPEKNIKLDACEITQGEWTKSGYFKIERIVVDPEPEPDKEKFVSGDYEYEITDEGTAAITKYLGKDKNVTVPSELDGKKVTWIRLEVFKDNKTVESVTIPDSVTQVGHQVFMGCSNLKEVKFPDTLKILGSGVFRDCTSIKEVTVPDSVEEMGIGMFRGCSSLEKVTLPNYGVSPFMYAGCKSLTYAPLSCDGMHEGETAVIPHKVFEGCESLTEVTIPEQVTKIFEGAFKDCVNLEKVVIPGDTEIIDGTEDGDYPVFHNCPKLTIYGYKGSKAEQYAKDHDIPFVELKEPEVETTGEFDYIVYDNGDVAIVKYLKNEKEVIVPTSINDYYITKIGSYKADDKIIGAFGGKDVEKVTLPDTVTEIYMVAFFDCQKLREINLPDSLEKIGGGAFAGTALESVTIPGGVATIPDHCFTESPMTELTIKDGVKEIQGTAFWKCANLTEVRIPKTVETVGDYAFANCDGLKDVYFYNPDTKIGDETFEDGEGGKVNVTVHGYAGSTAEKFAKDKGYEFVPIDGEPLPPPENVITVGDFDYLDMGEGLVLIGYNGTDEEVIIPYEVNGKQVLTIGQESFKGNTSVKSVKISTGIKNIGPQAFADCENLTSVEIPETVENIEGGAFANCALEEVDLPSGLKEIASHAFAQNPLKNVNIPYGVETIGESAFWQCDELTEVVIPYSVKDVQGEAFCDCDKLTDVTFLNPDTKIADNVFTDREGNTINVNLHGQENSTAQKLAEKNENVTFEVIDDSCKLHIMFGLSKAEGVDIENGECIKRIAGTEDSYTLPTPTLEGAEFLGWYKLNLYNGKYEKIDGDVTWETFLVGDSPENSALAMEIPVYPVFKKAAAKGGDIVLDANGGKIDGMDTLALDICNEHSTYDPKGRKQILAPFTTDDDSFLGWNTKADGTGVTVNEITFSTDGKTMAFDLEKREWVTLSDKQEQITLYAVRRNGEQSDPKETGDEPEPEPKPTLPGDVDGDGVVTSGDALAILRASLDPSAADETFTKAADVDGDGMVSSSDALTVLRMSLGL